MRTRVDKRGPATRRREERIKKYVGRLKARCDAFVAEERERESALLETIGAALRRDVEDLRPVFR